MTIPPPPPPGVEPPVGAMSVPELVALVRRRDPYRGRAVFELAARARTDHAAATALGELSRLPSARQDRLFHLVSLAWAAITGLLAAETEQARRVAYAAFADLEAGDRADLLAYLKVAKIEDAHPRM